MKILNTVLLNEELDAIHNGGFHITGTGNVVATLQFEKHFIPCKR